MKTIALVYDINTPHWESTFRENFKEVFGDAVQVMFHTYEGLGHDAPIQCDLVIEMRQGRIASLKSHLPEPRQIMVLNRTLRRKAIQPIFSIPAGASVLVVNDSLISTMDSVGLFMLLDLNHLHFVPYEAGMDCSAFQIAVTLGEPQFVPRSIGTVIDVGHRCIDISSCIEIMRRLGLSGHALDQRLLR